MLLYKCYATCKYRVLFFFARTLRYRNLKFFSSCLQSCYSGRIFQTSIWYLTMWATKKLLNNKKKLEKLKKTAFYRTWNSFLHPINLKTRKTLLVKLWRLITEVSYDFRRYTNWRTIHEHFWASTKLPYGFWAFAFWWANVMASFWGFLHEVILWSRQCLQQPDQVWRTKVSYRHFETDFDVRIKLAYALR